MQCDEDPKDGEFYGHLYKLKDDPRFIASVAQYLLRRDIAHFTQGQRAPLTKAKIALLERTRSEDEQILHDVVKRWPVDIITSEELRELMGENRIQGAALRYALERAGIEKVGSWKGCGMAHSMRRNVNVYAVRNYSKWKGVAQTALRAEVARITSGGKEVAFNGDAEDLL